MEYNCNSENFFEELKNFDNDKKNILNLKILDTKDIDKIVKKLLNFDKLKINLNLSKLNLENIPLSIFQLVNVYELNLDNNKLQSINDSICKLKKLKILRISYNKFSPMNICDLNLKYIGSKFMIVF